MSASIIDRRLRGAKTRAGANKRHRRYSLAQHRNQLPLKADAWPDRYAQGAEPAGQKNDFRGRFQGKFIALESGLYVFGMSTDDRGDMFLNGVQIITNTSSGSGILRSSGIYLDVGTHDLQISWGQGGGGYNVRSYITLPGGIEGNGQISSTGGNVTLCDIGDKVNGTFTASNFTIAGQSTLHPANITAGTNPASVRFEGGAKLLLPPSSEPQPPLMPTAFSNATLFLQMGITNTYHIDTLLVPANTDVKVEYLGVQGLWGRYYAMPASTAPTTVSPHFLSVAASEAYFATSTPLCEASSWDNGTNIFDFGESGELFPAAARTQREYWGAIWKGQIVIPEMGAYEFMTRSDDNSMLFINGALSVNNNNDHSMRDIFATKGGNTQLAGNNLHVEMGTEPALNTRTLIADFTQTTPTNSPHRQNTNTHRRRPRKNRPTKRPTLRHQSRRHPTHPALTAEREKSKKERRPHRLSFFCGRDDLVLRRAPKPTFTTIDVSRIMFGKILSVGSRRGRTFMLRNRTAWFLFFLLAGLFGLLLLWPILNVVSGGFYVNGRWTAEYLLGVFKNPIYTEGLFNSLRLAVGSTFLACLLSIPLAWLAHSYSFRGLKIFSVLVLVPMVLPPFVGAIGLTQILGPYGALNALLGCGAIDWLGQSRYFGVIVLQALAFYPIIYLNVSAALANIDPALHEASQNLGGNAWRTFWRVTFPLVMPGMFAGCTLVFIACFTELGTPLMLNYTRCAAVQVYDELKEISGSPFPYALVTVVLCCSATLYALSKYFFGRKAYAMQGKATVQHKPKVVGGVVGLLLILPFIMVTVLALMPHLGVIFTSVSVPGSWYKSILPQQFTGANYAEALGHGMTLNAIRNSLVFSSLAVVFNMTIGVAVAWVVVRSRIRVRGLLDGLAMIPLAVPGLVMAFGFISISGMLAAMPWVKAYPTLAALLDIRTNPTLFLVVAYAVRRLPYMVRAAIAGLQQTSVTLEEASANLGASPFVTLRRVTLPLITANLIAGALLAFAFSMLEVSDSLMLAQKVEYYPITKTIFELFQLMGIGRFLAAALGVWAMVFLCVTIVGASLLLGKKLGALFRA